MTVNQNEMVTSIRERLDEATAGEWSDTEIRRWINLGVKDVCRETEVLDTFVSFPVVAGATGHAGPNDMIRCSHVDWVPDDSSGNVYPLEWRDFNAMDPIWYANREISGSRPQFFTITGFVPSSQFLIYPIANADGNLNIKYYRLPADLTLDGTEGEAHLDLPEGWDDAVANYAEYMALRKDRDPRWQEAKSLYDETKQTLHGLSRFLSDQPGQVVPVANHGGLPAWLTEW